MPAKIIDIPDIGPVKLFKRSGASAIRLSITAKGEVRVTMPTWAPYVMGTRFVRGHADWINQQRTKYQAPLLSHQQAIGKSHTLMFVADASLRKPTSRVSGNIIKIAHPPHMYPGHEAVQTSAVAASQRALRMQAEEQLPPRLRALADKHGFSYRSVEVKMLTGRWGSCDSHKHIILNLYLMQLPWTLIDYVLLHELTHTEVLRHGPDFWGAMAEVLPDVKVRRLAMKRWQPVIMGTTA